MNVGNVRIKEKVLQESGQFDDLKFMYSETQNKNLKMKELT